MRHCGDRIYKAIERISIYPLCGAVCCRYLCTGFDWKAGDSALWWKFTLVHSKSRGCVRDPLWMSATFIRTELNLIRPEPGALCVCRCFSDGKAHSKRQYDFLHYSQMTRAFNETATRRGNSRTTNLKKCTIKSKKRWIW